MEMSRLVRLYAGNLVKREVILAAGDKLKELKLEASSQVTNELLRIGDETWICVDDLEQEHDTKPFFSVVRLSTITKMLSKFSFGDTLMKNLAILYPFFLPLQHSGNTIL